MYMNILMNINIKLLFAILIISMGILFMIAPKPNIILKLPKNKINI